MTKEVDDFNVGYMCQIDFEEELGRAAGGVGIYPSIEDLKKNVRCTTEGCGIVKVRVEFVEVVQEELESFEE